MPKMKTNRGARKRFKVTKKGEVKFFRANKRHILTKKTTKRKRHLRNMKDVAQADVPLIKRLLGD